MDRPDPATGAQPAPLFEDVARAPSGGAATWLTTADGLRIRVALWGKATATRGTVLIFPGRTEYVEKYGGVAADLVARGFAVLAVDWRGQGIAARIHPNPVMGHVDRFDDYQADVAAVIDHAGAEGLPGPWFLIAHSMGGCIGLRALMRGLKVRAAVFSAPMWGIRMPSAMRPLAWGLSTASRGVGLSHRLAPGQQLDPYVAREGFEDNNLTTDPQMYALMRDQVAAHPELSLGGPSLCWLNEALREMRAAAQAPAPRVPALVFLGTDERIVDPARIHARVASWPGTTLRILDGARHELLMERSETRMTVLAATEAHFAAHA